MNFKRITIKNFKCFYDQITLDLGRPGLFFITGINEFDDFGTNGVGKSTLWDAMSWCIYGKTTVGERGPSLVFRTENLKNNETTSVQLEIVRGDEKFTITRTMKPNTLSLRSFDKVEIVEQSHIDKLMGMNHKMFHSFVVFGQKADTFLSLSRSARVDLLSSCMGLDKWKHLSDEARAGRNRLEYRLYDYGTEVARLNSSLKEIKDVLKTHALSKRELISKLKSKTVKIYQEKRLFLDTKTNLIRDLKELEALFVRLKKSSKYKYLKDLVSDIEELEFSIEKRLSFIAGRKDSLGSDVLQGKSNTCPSCGQDITKVKKRFMSHYKAQVALLDVDKNKLETKLSNILNRRKKILELIKKHEARITSTGCKIDDLRKELEVIEKRLFELEQLRDLDSMKSTLKLVNKNIEKYRSRIRELMDKRKSVKTSRHKCEVSYRAYSYWVDGFKQIRLLCLRDAVKVMNIQAQAHLSFMGFTDLDFLFEFVESGSKDIYNLNMKLISRSTGHTMSWESCSGGEQQRLKLACVFSFIDALQMHQNIDTNLEVWDEPSTGLSETGIDDLVCSLKERADNHGKQIWMVDHNEISYSGFDGVMILKKDSEGKSNVSRTI